MTADQLAEPRSELIHVVKTSPYTYQSISGHYVQDVTCSNGNSYFLADFTGIKNLKYHPKLVLKESRFLHHPIDVSQRYRKVVKHAQIHGAGMNHLIAVRELTDRAQFRQPELVVQQ